MKTSTAADSGNTTKGSALLDLERISHLQKVGAALLIQNWAMGEMSQALIDHLQAEVELLEETTHQALDDAEKPLSAADQIRYQERRKERMRVIGMLKDKQTAAQRAVADAQSFERSESNDNGMHYTPPAWNEDWIAEASKRMEAGTLFDGKTAAQFIFGVSDDFTQDLDIDIEEARGGEASEKGKAGDKKPADPPALPPNPGPYSDKEWAEICAKDTQAKAAEPEKPAAPSEAATVPTGENALKKGEFEQAAEEKKKRKRKAA